ncbi:DUF1571 domain-containing protein [Reichenbachiella carrageenanivorans]|uniref:DUF1571 domain-containing protein n=1 Tax=Reichenbachiella carrageenanivorans TaxID=2979869 RepID=A0ABY6D098_9BACT|nr:DUF1571 domain-containing protein [Reichenbachiella carrageenanivorans]UXX79591.1 DUF1571 domain-containing protein [Reichenbachiella carrageenanivorans]
MTRTGCCALLFFFFISPVYGQSPTPSGYEIAKLMFEYSDRIQSLTYTITKQERVEGEILKQVSFTKMQKSPYSVYLRQSFPNDGMEVLYVRGANNDKALINPNGFPWINLKLDPLDGIMRNNQHHTIFQSGFDHVVSILEFLCAKYQDQIDEMVTYTGLVIHEGKNCHAITFINPYFGLVDYIIQPGESIEDVAAQKKLSAHMILEANPKIKDYEDVKSGQVIQIPNDYSPKLNLIIDAQVYIPLKMEVIDDKGLYEQYEYSKVVINPTFDPTEFTEGYEGYGF